MNRSRFVLSAFVCATLGGCVSTPLGDKAGEELGLLQADRDFAADAKVRGIAAAFADRYLADGKLISPGAPVLVGPAAVRNALAKDTSQWEWAPEEARVSGDLGVTWGRAVIRYTDEKGQPKRAYTRYVTAWKRRPGGTWKIWLDIGNSGPDQE